MWRKMKNLAKNLIKCGGYTALGLVIVYASLRHPPENNPPPNWPT